MVRPGTCRESMVANLTPGWWLAKRADGTSGWTPAAYLEEVKVAPPPPPVASRPPPPAAPNGVNGAAAKGKVPPAPPSKRPAGRKPAPAPGTPRDSGYSTQQNGGDNSGTSTPAGGAGNAGLAGGLAAALKARQQAMNKPDGANDDW